jgi:hypothetical protein
MFCALHEEQKRRSSPTAKGGKKPPRLPCKAELKKKKKSNLCGISVPHIICIILTDKAQ